MVWFEIPYRPDDTSLLEGTELTVNPAATNHLSVSALDPNSAVLCFNDLSNQERRCSLLQRNATSVSSSAAMSIGVESPFVDVEALDWQTALVCFSDASPGAGDREPTQMAIRAAAGSRGPPLLAAEFRRCLEPGRWRANPESCCDPPVLVLVAYLKAY